MNRQSWIALKNRQQSEEYRGFGRNDGSTGVQVPEKPTTPACHATVRDTVTHDKQHTFASTYVQLGSVAWLATPFTVRRLTMARDWEDRDAFTIIGYYYSSPGPARFQYLLW
jgi:hypothetical protein